MVEGLSYCIVAALPLAVLALIVLAAQHFLHQRSVWLRKRAEVLASALSLRECIESLLGEVSSGEGGPVPVEPTNALAAIGSELSYTIECLRFSRPSGLDFLLDRHMGTLVKHERRIGELQALLGTQDPGPPKPTGPGEAADPEGGSPGRGAPPSSPALRGPSAVASGRQGEERGRP